jgi:hypothetical protein
VPNLGFSCVRKAKGLTSTSGVIKFQALCRPRISTEDAQGEPLLSDIRTIEVEIVASRSAHREEYLRKAP